MIISYKDMIKLGWAEIDINEWEDKIEAVWIVERHSGAESMISLSSHQSQVLHKIDQKIV